MRALWFCAAPICRRCPTIPTICRPICRRWPVPPRDRAAARSTSTALPAARCRSKDSIREIRINQNPFSPEYDKLGYGRIEILTKPGTDKLHGNVNVDFGDAIWDARNPYAAQKAPFLQRNFGGSLSGALGKKASFFLDVQDRDIDNGNIINGFNVSANSFLVSPFNSVFVAPQTRFRISPRIDYQLSTNNTLTMRYGYTRNDLQNQGVGNLSLLSAALSRSGHGPHPAVHRNGRP